MEYERAVTPPFQERKKEYRRRGIPQAYSCNQDCVAPKNHSIPSKVTMPVRTKPFNFFEELPDDLLLLVIEGSMKIA